MDFHMYHMSTQKQMEMKRYSHVSDMDFIEVHCKFNTFNMLHLVETKTFKTKLCDALRWNNVMFQCVIVIKT